MKRGYKGNAGVSGIIMGIFLLIVGFLTKIQTEIFGLILIVFGLAFIILGIYNWGKPNIIDVWWNKRTKQKEELRKAQLQALRKGKVNVELKGKMKKLK